MSCCMWTGRAYSKYGGRTRGAASFLRPWAWCATCSLCLFGSLSETEDFTICRAAGVLMSSQVSTSRHSCCPIVREHLQEIIGSPKPSAGECLCSGGHTSVAFILWNDHGIASNHT